jgi:two-component system, OmpR family, response regulator VanR
MMEYLNRFTLLYIEDEEEISNNFFEYFKTFFKDVYLSANGKDGLALYKRYKPDVVILDINIPEINGLEFAKIVRENDKYTRIIMLTAYTDIDILLKATEINMSKYIVKSNSMFQFKEVFNKIAKELLELSSDIVRLDESYYYILHEQKLMNGEKIVQLCEKERRLLNLLVLKKNQTVHIEEIIVTIWDEIFYDDISKDSVKSQVSYLRKKLPKNSIYNVYGKGYSLKV